MLRIYPDRHREVVSRADGRFRRLAAVADRDSAGCCCGKAARSLRMRAVTFAPMIRTGQPLEIPTSNRRAASRCELLLHSEVLAMNSGVDAITLKHRPKREGMICTTYENDRGTVGKKGLNAMHPNYLAIFCILYVQGAPLFGIRIAINVSRPQHLGNFFGDRRATLH